MIREAGSALAVLAIYVLTLLLPLHQAAALQRDLARVGYETIGVWSVCTPLVQDEHGNDRSTATVKCPAAGFAKGKVTPLLPNAAAAVDSRTVESIGYGVDAPRAIAALPAHVAQSRAPPIAV